MFSSVSVPVWKERTKHHCADAASTFGFFGGKFGFLNVNLGNCGCQGLTVDDESANLHQSHRWP